MPLEIDVSKVSPRNRVDGEGTIRRLARRSLYEGRIPVRISEDNPATKRVSVFGRTQKEVRGKLDKLREQGFLIVDEPPPPQLSPTLAEYLKDWSETGELEALWKVSNYRVRELNIRRIIPIIGDIRLDELGVRHIRHMLAELKRKGLAPASCKQALSVLRTALGVAFADDIIVSDPFKKWRKDATPKSEKRPIHVMTMSQKAKLFALNDEWTPFWQIQLATGMRSGEALALTWDDIELPEMEGDNGLLHVRKSIHRRTEGSKVSDGWLGYGDTYYLDTPKTITSRRPVVLYPPVAQVFRDIKVRQEAEKERVGKEWSNEKGFVFTWHNGEPMVPHNAYYYLQSSLKKVGLGSIRVHDLRHTHISDQMLQGGTRLESVSKMVGHSSVAFTMDVYGHLLKEVESQAAEAASRLLEETMRMAQLHVASNEAEARAA